MLLSQFFDRIISSDRLLTSIMSQFCKLDSNKVSGGDQIVIMTV